jgi:hypothetical protein
MRISPARIRARASKVGVQVKPAIGLPLDDHGLAEAFVAKAALEAVPVHLRISAFGLTVCARLMILG